MNVMACISRTLLVLALSLHAHLVASHQVLVLNPELLDPSSPLHRIADHVSFKTWSDVHGRLLHFEEGKAMPSRRACSLHATRALQCAVQQGWVETAIRLHRLSDEDTHVDQAAWAASPSFDPQRIQVFLQGVEEGDDVDDEGAAEAAGGGVDEEDVDL